MRTRYGWLLLGAILLMLPLVGCNNDNDDNESNWSDGFLQRFYIGNVPVQAGETVNVPLGSTYSLRFELSRPATLASLTHLLDFQMAIENMDNGETALLTDCNMAENGGLVWTDGSNMNIEFRFNHDMSFFYAGGEKRELGSVGQTFKVRLLFLVGLAEDGNQFALTNDEFYVVWTAG